MDDSNKGQEQRVINKKLWKTHVEKQLEAALDSLKDVLGEKKFGKRIKKASRLLTKGMKSNSKA
jgi:hypothetical protein